MSDFTAVLKIAVITGILSETVMNLDVMQNSYWINGNGNGNLLISECMKFNISDIAFSLQ